MMKLKFFSKLLDKRIAAYQRELIETHYKEVDNMYRQMRGWRHDYRGHIQTMKVLAAQGDLDGIKAYLDALDTDLNTVDLAVKTGNAMADAIINSKISLAKSRNIPVQIDAHIPVKLKMSELDLCCILGNLFDNAMDASAELPEEERLTISNSLSQVRRYCEMPLKLLKAEALVGGEEAMDRILRGLFNRELDPMYPYLTYQDFLNACGLTEEDLNLA